MFYSVINSRFSHPISSAILAKVCRSGWCMLERANIIKVGDITKRIPQNCIYLPMLGLRYAYATIWHLSLCNKLIGFGVQSVSKWKEKVVEKFTKRKLVWILTNKKKEIVAIFATQSSNFAVANLQKVRDVIFLIGKEGMKN